VRITLVDPDAFLKQEVESATPAKLRWLLIRKAVGLAEVVDYLWADRKFEEASQWWLRVQDILSELLDGVTDPKNPAAKPISDLYIFLAKLGIELSLSKDRQGLASFIEVLKIEQETWDLFQRRESQIGAPPMHFGNGNSVPSNVGVSEESEFNFQA
jgi:flagellar secretion chaperone FliS